MTSLSQPECVIVQLDDCLQDLILFQAALLRMGLPVGLRPFLDVETAAEWFQRRTTLHNDEALRVPSVFLCDCDIGRPKSTNVVGLVRTNPACAGVSIIMLSSAPDDDAVGDAYRAGANHFLKKPFNEERMDIFAKTLYHCAVSENFAALMRLKEYVACPAQPD